MRYSNYKIYLLLSFFFFNPAKPFCICKIAMLSLLPSLKTTLHHNIFHLEIHAIPRHPVWCRICAFVLWTCICWMFIGWISTECHSTFSPDSRFMSSSSSTEVINEGDRWRRGLVPASRGISRWMSVDWASLCLLLGVI